jgi:hypothetical protein
MDHLHAAASSLTPPVARLVVDADFDPQLPGRVLDKFADRGLLPSHFSAQLADGGLQLVVEFSGDPDWARYLSRKLLNGATVRSIDLSFRRAAVTRQRLAA